MQEIIKVELDKYGIEYSDEQFDKLSRYYGLLVQWNQKMNLTAITEEEEVYRKHFLDSLTAAFSFDFSAVETLCDVGSGAGFPSLVLKIFYPHLQITIVEALEKRITFLKAIVNELELSNVTLLHERAEHLAETKREYFDVVTARAVARLPMLAELCIPLLKVDGTFIVLKGERGIEELDEAQIAYKNLGIGTTKVKELFLDNQNKSDKRVILYSKKDRHTPQKYPRAYAQIKKNPL